MAEMLRGYDFEPEYTEEEIESRKGTNILSAVSPVVSEWCHCACCHDMPTSEECTCCRSSELTCGNIKEGFQCITEDRRMQTVVLNDDVLSVMYVQMMLDTGKQGKAPDILDDKYV